LSSARLSASGAKFVHELYMAGKLGSFSPRSAFQRLLERMEARDGAGARITPPTDDERLYPRLSIPPLQGFRAFAAVGAYAAQEEEVPPPPKAQTPPVEAHFASIRKELRSARGVDDLRRLRRACARLVHPDRLPADERAAAERFMAEINAAIDRAIKDKSAR
jgi:hypothetical protein